MRQYQEFHGVRICSFAEVQDIFCVWAGSFGVFQIIRRFTVFFGIFMIIRAEFLTQKL